MAAKGGRGVAPEAVEGRAREISAITTLPTGHANAGLSAVPQEMRLAASSMPVSTSTTPLCRTTPTLRASRGPGPAKVAAEVIACEGAQPNPSIMGLAATTCLGQSTTSATLVPEGLTDAPSDAVTEMGLSYAGAASVFISSNSTPWTLQSKFSATLLVLPFRHMGLYWMRCLKVIRRRSGPTVSVSLPLLSGKLHLQKLHLVREQ